MDVREFKKQPIMGIVRGVNLGQIGPLIETVISSGLKAIEITMNTNDAANIISKAKKVAKKGLTLGAGTVLDMRSLRLALDAGASFIVMPVLIEGVVAYCTKYKIPVFPGALTPQEIYKAWRCGATMVKVFPAKFFGPEYFHEIKAPLNGIELMAVGGVTPKNMRQYFDCGANAIAFGSSVFKSSWLQKGDYKSISRSIKSYLQQLP